MLKKLIAGLSFFMIFAGMFGSTVLAAPPQQWFPSAGTGLDYSLSWSLAYFNGTKATDQQFDVYKSNSSNDYYLINSLQDLNYWAKSAFPSWILLVTKTSITVHHAYSSATASTLNRTISIHAGNITIAKGTVNVFGLFNASSSTQFDISLQSDLVQKSGFFTSGQSFLDYFDNSLLPGEKFVAPMDYQVPSIVSASILAKTDSAIVGAYNESTDFNFTYIAAGSGQVQSLTEVGSYYFFWKDIRSFSVTFALVTGGSNALPGPLPIIVIGVLSAMTMVWILKKRHDLRFGQGT
ncbi:MAG TPA: hypothetical protein VKM55_25940 [Candidatus Lokiarchaeia archaeon]|nr:hypothetical protein [Candidatus Lokiarchaeia archaeon]